MENPFNIFYYIYKKQQQQVSTLTISIAPASVNQYQLRSRHVNDHATSVARPHESPIRPTIGEVDAEPPGMRGRGWWANENKNLGK